MKKKKEPVVFSLDRAEREVKSLGFPLSVRTLREHIKKGDLEAKKIGRAYSVSRESLERFVGARG